MYVMETKSALVNGHWNIDRTLHEMSESLIGQTLTCAETGKQFIGAVEGFSTNYARDSAGRVYCDEGVDAREKRDMLDRSKPFTCYISSDGKHATGWKGNILGRVISSSPIRLTR